MAGPCLDLRTSKKDNAIHKSLPNNFLLIDSKDHTSTTKPEKDIGLNLEKDSQSSVLFPIPLRPIPGIRTESPFHGKRDMQSVIPLPYFQPFHHILPTKKNKQCGKQSNISSFKTCTGTISPKNSHNLKSSDIVLKSEGTDGKDREHLPTKIVTSRKRYCVICRHRKTSTPTVIRIQSMYECRPCGGIALCKTRGCFQEFHTMDDEAKRNILKSE